MDSVCANCKYDNPLGANYCMSCGSNLDRPGGDHITESLAATADQVAVVNTSSSFAEPAGMLVVRQGQNRGSRIALDAAVVSIGRHPESDIFLDDITVSRRHAEVHKLEGGFKVRDAGSLNGTYINRTLVEQAPLVDGDELQVGKFKLVFVALGDSALGDEE